MLKVIAGLISSQHEVSVTYIYALAREFGFYIINEVV